jgi:hypothetical protein
MLSGFNTNFRYRGVLFHVQTEDSGLENPHVITHLFHGGNILASEKRDYSDLISEGSIEEPVRKLMETQHKSMLKQLSRGEHDSVISERLGPELFRVDEDEVAPPAVTEESPPAARTPSVAEATLLDALQGESVSAPGSIDSVEDIGPGDLPPPASEESARLSRVFGDRVVSEKPLDEVVLDYLVENARKRKRPPK